jgi:hypothetical protein
MRPKRTISSWVENRFIGEPVPPELDFLINRLMEISATNHALSIEHARKIYTAYRLWRYRPDRHGFKVKGKTRFRAERVSASRGLKADLLRLRLAAKGHSAKEWQTAWLGVSGAAKAALKLPAPPKVERKLNANGRITSFRRAPLDTSGMIMVRVPGLHALIPGAADTLPRIEAALARGFPSKREVNKLLYTFVLRVRDAYQSLAGKVGLTYRSLPEHGVKGKFDDAGLIALAKDIDRKFGTNALTVSRLRKKEADLGFSFDYLENLRKPWGERTS